MGMCSRAPGEGRLGDAIKLRVCVAMVSALPRCAWRPEEQISRSVLPTILPKKGQVETGNEEKEIEPDLRRAAFCCGLAQNGYTRRKHAITTVCCSRRWDARETYLEMRRFCGRRHARAFDNPAKIARFCQ